MLPLVRRLPQTAEGSSNRNDPGPAGRLSLVTPNSRVHWGLLVLGVAGAVAFNATVFVDGALRAGYDWLRQPMSALSLGAGGAVQITNFIAFGVLTCLTAPAWRATLAPGRGHRRYPRLRLVAGLAMVGAGLFPQDPALGFPLGASAPAHPSWHAQLHLVMAITSLVANFGELLVLSRRLAGEPRWRGWDRAALASGVLMAVFLAAFGFLTAQHSYGGIFEKLASLAPTLFGIALTLRLVINRDARISAGRLPE